MTIVIMLEQRQVDQQFVTIIETRTQLMSGDPNPYPGEALRLSELPRNDRVMLIYVKPSGLYQYVYVNGKRTSTKYQSVELQAYEDTSEIDALLAEMSLEAPHLAGAPAEEV